MVIDWRADKNDVLFQQPRINIVSTFAAASLFDHHRDRGCAAVLGLFVFSHFSDLLAGFWKWFVRPWQLAYDPSTASCRRCGANLGVLCQPIESFIAPQLSFHPIQRSLLCQTSANCIRRFATMSREVFKFVGQVFVGHVNLFCRGYAVDDELRLHIILCALLLPPSQ